MNQSEMMDDILVKLSKLADSTGLSKAVLVVQIAQALNRVQEELEKNRREIAELKRRLLEATNGTEGNQNGRSN